VSGSVVGVGPSQGRTRRVRLPLVRALALVLAASVGCTDPFGPDRLVSLRPEMRRLSFDDLATGLRDGGILYVYGTPSDSTFSLEPGQRVPLEIAVSSGDRDSVGLYNILCPHRERLPGHIPCFDLSLVMHEGHDPTEFAGELSAAGGRFVLISATRWFAAVVFFSPDDPIGRAKRARSWPGVAFTELMVSTCIVASCPSLTVPVPIDVGLAVPGDGIVQVRPGDTLSVTYRQPRGGVLTLQLLVP
jgi:hypothetical protein